MVWYAVKHVKDAFYILTRVSGICRYCMALTHHKTTLLHVVEEWNVEGVNFEILLQLKCFMELIQEKLRISYLGELKL